MEIKISKWDLIKSFYTAKVTIYKTKRKPSEWEKIFSSKETDKGLNSQIYKQLMQINVKKTNNPTKKWIESLNGNSAKIDIQITYKHMKKSSPLLTIREMQIKTTVRYHGHHQKIYNNKC